MTAAAASKMGRESLKARNQQIGFIDSNRLGILVFFLRPRDVSETPAFLFAPHDDRFPFQTKEGRAMVMEMG